LFARPGDVPLIVDVAHSAIRFDREVKLERYARHGIPEVWLLDLADGELNICR
jgi:Uma2 family endonuclease